MVKGWTKVKIGNIADFQGGSQPPLYTFIDTEKAGYIRLIQIRDYKTDKYATYVPQYLVRKFCEADDIMIGRYGPPIFQILQGLTGAYNVALMKAIPKNIDKKYLWHTLKRGDIFSYVELWSRRSSGQTGVDLENLKIFEIDIPISADEQATIAEALSDTDAYIAALEKLIAKKKAIKVGAMQELLTGKRRLKGFVEKWDEKNIEALTTRAFAGGTPSTSIASYWGGSNIWLPSGRCQNNVINKQQNEIYITDSGLADSAAKLIREGSVLIAITGATCGNIAYLPFSAAANQSVVALETNDDTDSKFLYYLLLTKRNVILSFQTGSAQGGTNLKAIKAIRLSVPKHKEQIAIASILSDMDLELDGLVAKLNKAKDIKLGMMQQLLTGQIRLVEVTKDTKFLDAITYAGIVDVWGREKKYPLGRVKVMKLFYLYTRKTGGDTERFHEHAAGPYDETIRYGGGEPLAVEKGFIEIADRGDASKFTCGSNIHEAKKQICDYDMTSALQWLAENFRTTTVEELELLATVDLARVRIEAAGGFANAQSVVDYISNSRDWTPKLARPEFHISNIAAALKQSRELFG